MQNNTARPMKALCLAAGFATRLRPFSETIPKAAMPIMGIPSLMLALRNIESLGLDQIAVNTHHLASAVNKLIEGYSGKAEIKISHEPEILGSGGALVPLRSWLGDDDLLIINPDVITDLNLSKFVDDFRNKDALVSIAVVAQHPQGLPGSVAHLNGRVTQINRNLDAKLSAAYGVGVFAVKSSFIDFLPQQGFANLTEAMNSAINAKQNVITFMHDGYFADFGESIQSYLQVHQDIIADRARLFHQLNIAELLADDGRELMMAMDDDGVVLGCIETTSMEAGTEIAEESRDFFVFEPSKLASDCLLSRCVLSSDSQIFSGDVLDSVCVGQHNVGL